MVFARPLAKARPLSTNGDGTISLSSDSGQAACQSPRGSKRKRPRTSRRDQQTLCRGLPGQACRYAADGSGSPARGMHAHLCIFCSPVAMAKTLETPTGRGSIVRLLKQWRIKAPAIFEEAFANSALTSAPDAVRQQLRASAERPVRTGARATAASRMSQDAALSWRQSVVAAPTTAQLQEYREGVADDRAYARRKFFPQRDRLVRHANFRWRNPMSPDLLTQVHDLAPNDTGLPAARVSATATSLETWCKQHSWKVCSCCGSVQPRHLKEADLSEKAPTALARCKNCSKPEAARLWVPSSDEVPIPLRGLSREVLLALRPLDIDCGPEWKADYGYFFHSTMIRLSWSESDVLDKIRALDNTSRKKAQKAFKWLLASDDSYYSAFLVRHRRFLREYPSADSDRRKRPLRFIEEDAVECCLWPHLYWDRCLCETSARLADVRRQSRAQACRADAGDSDEAEDELEEATRQSLRRSFLAKAMGPIADYAGDHELLHFVFDLYMWSDVGGKKGALHGMPMWRALKGAPWTPQYWKVRHAAALDMQAQCGFPVAFFTWAPFEWSAPYHQWILRQMEHLGRHRLGLAGPEALHLAHLLTELFREWVCGGGRKFGDATSTWNNSLFSNRRSDGSRVRVNFVGRLEFQDGKRREISQDYHGRAAVHLHGLVFAEEIGPSQLHTKICGTVPPEGDSLRGYVLDGQAGRTGSGLPIQEQASYFDPIGDAVHLEHRRLDKHLGIRGYSPELLDVLKCHQDVQVQRGTGLMLKYAATYLPKFSDGPGKELMDDSSSAYAAARRVLFTFHPGEPEMWLLLASQAFPMFFLGGTMRPIIAPHPGMPRKPDYVLQYEAAGWRGEMTLLEFLRKVNAKGAILEHIRKSHPAAIRSYMAVRAHREAFIETVLSMVSAQEGFVQQHLDGQLVLRANAVVPMQLSYADADAGDELHFTAQQTLLENHINRRVDQALRVRLAEDDVEYERLLGLAEEHGAMVAATGAPGTGKSAVLDRCIRRAVGLGARVLVALPTGVQRARMKQRHPNVELDTCHGAFLFHKPLNESLGILAAYDLIVIDEAFQLVEEHFGRLDQMWLAAAKVPCLVMAGDEWQLPPPDRNQRNLAQHPKWKTVCKVELHHVWRQESGDPLLGKLMYLRKNRPMGQEGSQVLRDLCRKHKAWSGHHEPTTEDIQRLLERTNGQTTVITCTRRGAALINGLCLDALFGQPRTAVLGKVQADFECNPENYDDCGQLLDRLPKPLSLPLYVGLRVRLTRNVDKPNDFVNGMSAVVLDFDRRKQAIHVETESKQLLCVYPITTDDVPGGRLTYYPIKLGYADTVHKYQGAELVHVTFWPDRPGCPAAGYVALSRVRRDADYLLGGCIKSEHFVPAR
ncbi:PIF1 [Symbiodinium sp. CCMP2592]|nr:PIF1 [Symbiodinium sp. CCMP2592]